MSLSVNASNALRAMVGSGFDSLVNNMGLVIGVASGVALGAGDNSSIVVLAIVVNIFSAALGMSGGELISVWVQNKSLKHEYVSCILTSVVSIVAVVIAGSIPLIGYMLGGPLMALLFGTLGLALLGLLASFWTEISAWKISAVTVLFGCLAAGGSWFISFVMGV